MAHDVAVRTESRKILEEITLLKDDIIKSVGAIYLEVSYILVA
jgi:hypothetical protein